MRNRVAVDDSIGHVYSSQINKDNRVYTNHDYATMQVHDDHMTNHMTKTWVWILQLSSSYQQ